MTYATVADHLWFQSLSPEEREAIVRLYDHEPADEGWLKDKLDEAASGGFDEAKDEVRSRLRSPVDELRSLITEIARTDLDDDVRRDVLKDLQRVATEIEEAA